MSIAPLTAIQLANQAVPLAERLVALPGRFVSAFRNRPTATGYAQDARPAAVRDAANAPATATASLAELRANGATALRENLAAFTERLGNLFRDSGIDMTQPVVLQRDAEGALVVANDHPDKAAIEALLARHPHAAEAFTRLEGATQQLQRVSLGAATPPPFRVTVGA
jgi:hypothetical protein